MGLDVDVPMGQLLARIAEVARDAEMDRETIETALDRLENIDDDAAEQWIRQRIF